MLEQPDMAAAQASWQAARAARREERARARAEREASKRQIVDRFQLQVGSRWRGSGAENGQREPMDTAAALVLAGMGTSRCTQL